MDSAEEWLIAIVGGAVAAVLGTGVLAIFNKHVREKFWKPIGRGVRWVLTLRPTTSTRQAAIEREMAHLREMAATSEKRFTEVCDLLDVTPVLADSTLVPERIQRLQEAAAEAWAHSNAEAAAARKHAQSQIDAVRSLAESQMRDAARAHEHQIAATRSTALEEGRAAGRAEVEAEVAAQRAAPPMQPVWRIDDPGPGANIYFLRNMQPGVTITDVSVEADSSEFVFSGPTQTRGPFENSLSFLGSKSLRGRKLGVSFTVRWRDFNGDSCARTVKVDRDPSRGIVVG
ncbi:hypothetical protein [Microbacterium hydrothermale]|uniref:hypothetical protein n=1 Tax=Microbacterium hydrothermale TaxID=857427 RepID=UPI0010A763F9|nr:hypothetical protein [Microbacterium hydrothermale]